MPDEGETLEAAARRETREETGVEVTGDLSDLGFTDYKKSRKRIFCFSAPAPGACQPRCASWEVDRAEFLPVDKALAAIHPDQAVFIERLLAQLNG